VKPDARRSRNRRQSKHRVPQPIGRGFLCGSHLNSK
jgi:hypothetical protein